MARRSLWDLAGVNSEQAKRGQALSLLSFKVRDPPTKKKKTEDRSYAFAYTRKVKRQNID